MQMANMSTRWWHTWAVALPFTACILGQTLENPTGRAPVPVDVPPVDEFLRLAGGRVSVTGDVVYYDGGELSQLNVTGWRHSNPLNSTLAIDLTSSWTPEDVLISETARPSNMPVMTQQSLLTDIESDTFYVWGGAPSWSDAPVEESRMWAFRVINGSGAWTADEPANSQLFKSIPPRKSAASVSTPTAGFIFGGTSSGGSDIHKREMNDHVALNFTTREWELNPDPEAPYSKDGTIIDASAVYASEFGPNGLIFLLGGISPGVEGTNGTFDILPAFKWTRLLGDQHGRGHFEHACAVVGQRQLLSWGGLTYPSTDMSAWNTSDIFPRGLGIFDLSDGVWKDRYDPDAGPYQAHSSVAALYENGEPIAWSSPEVKALFVTDSGDRHGKTDNSSKLTKVQRAGLITGLIVGGLFLLLLLGFCAYYETFLRWKRSHEPRSMSPSVDMYMHGKREMDERS
ncbi:hypothetical protein F5X68DRAFT_252812 [Plectosphaerella plurivora]|uniref:Kelch repeat protein n=1 Tax=Plectosphaerella plurivora TaxID=936078 RepID=A0A9P8VHF7_9PEZI|nr:hypothetical protein F5X68DRAFT_252812 [Plectosphaerella plurivora]